MMQNKSNIILEVKGLKKYFPLEKDILGRPTRYLRAVDDVSFTLEAGKTIGVVGESGCGKTTLGRTILQLYDTTGGKTLYYGHSVAEKLPKYFIKGINNLPKYASKLNNLITKLQNAYSYNPNEFTLKDYEDLKNKIEDEKIIEVIDEIIKVLKESSAYTGGYILCNVNEAKNLILAKLNKEHEYYISRDENILTEVESIEKELNELQKECSNINLFNELEQYTETGLDLAKLTRNELRLLRTEIQLIFQDPYSSLPPRMTIGQILTEPVQVHKVVEKDKISEHVRKVMKMCGLQPQYYDRYPHEFSGGQRQRICIARALVVNPKLVICDEPVSALDVSIQAQIINLLKELQNDLGLTYMFISHDLSVVKYITDSIIVMYLGNMMEIGDTNDIFDNPLHPYTQALFSAVPVPDPDAKMQRIILKGDIPSPANPPKGCKFHTRCDKCMAVCKLKTPSFIEHGEKHLVACHLYDEEVIANLAKYEAELAEIEKAEEKTESLETK